MKKLMAVILLTALLCTGCGYHAPVATPETHRVVTGIDITYHDGPILSRLHYTDSQKMSVILHYLRFIDPYGTPQEKPETVAGSDFYIVLTFSDETVKWYRQHANRYLQEGGGSWKCIDPKKALELSRILCQMDSDEI